MKSEVLDQVESLLNEAWQILDKAQHIAYKEGYNSLEFQLRGTQMSIEETIGIIEEKHFGDEDTDEEWDETIPFAGKESW